MSQKLPNYLKTHRKRAGFTQEEIAFLLGCKSGSKISRYETFQSQPIITTVFAYQIIFNVPAHELFAGVYQQVEGPLMKRVQTLIRDLDPIESNILLKRKKDHLTTILS